MKTAWLIAALFAAPLLGGCPDTKLPQTPPPVPQPKAASTALPVIVDYAGAEFFA